MAGGGVAQGGVPRAGHAPRAVRRAPLQGRHGPRFIGRMRLFVVPLLCLTGVLSAQSPASPRPTPPVPGRAPSPVAPLPPNELGRIPIVEWHQVGDTDGSYKVSRARFLAELTALHARGYVPIALDDLLTGRIDLPAGKSPVLFTFDDSSPSQFRYLMRNGQLVIDSTSALGMLEGFLARHPDWAPRALFCLLPAADAGHAFFGDKGIDGQLTAWRFPKLRHLVARGYELCNHTLWHANLGRMSNAGVQEQIARAQLAVDSAGTGVQMRTLALPLGVWPKDRTLLKQGSWTDPRSRRTTTYTLDAILMVAGGPAKSPFDPAFDAQRIPRVQVFANELVTLLDRLDRQGNRYVAGPAVNAAPRAR